MAAAVTAAPAAAFRDEFAPVRSVYHCNRAACLQQLGREEEAVAECAAAVALDPGYVKVRG